MDEIVKKHGKQMIVWEGFGRHGKVPIPKDVIVMTYEIRFYMPQDLIDDGYKIINASWTPLTWSTPTAGRPRRSMPGTFFSSSPSARSPRTRAGFVQPSNSVLGAQMSPGSSRKRWNCLACGTACRP